MQNQIPKNWQKVKLGEKVDITSSKRIFAHEYLKSGVPFYRGKEIIEKFNGNEVSTDLFISPQKFKDIESRFGVPQAGDMLLTSVGTLGIPYLVGKDEKFYFKDGNLTWFRKFKGLDNRFLYLWIQSPLGKGQLIKHIIGSSQQALTIDGLKKIEIDLPPINIQNQISSVLSAFDDKIEVNNKIAKTLEEMAQVIFKEWFVNFKFPGYEEAEFIDSELGKIPKDWKILKFEEYARLEYGKALQEEKRIKGDILVYGSSGLVGTHTEKLCEGPGIVVGRKGNVGSIFWVNNNFYPIDTTFYVKTNKSLYYIYFVLKNMRFHTGDSAVPGLNRESVHSQEIVIPDNRIIDQFDLMIKPIYEKLNNLQEENQKLAALRDLLLPKLMRGEIRV